MRLNERKSKSTRDRAHCTSFDGGSDDEQQHPVEMMMHKECVHQNSFWKSAEIEHAGITIQKNVSLNEDQIITLFRFCGFRSQFLFVFSGNKWIFFSPLARFDFAWMDCSVDSFVSSLWPLKMVVFFPLHHFFWFKNTFVRPTRASLGIFFGLAK